MSDEEFDVLDELYFVISYDELEENLPHLKKVLKDLLSTLLKKGYIKCLVKDSEEEVLDTFEFNLNYKKYNYLATKAGLLAHNSK